MGTINQAFELNDTDDTKPKAQASIMSWIKFTLLLLVLFFTLRYAIGISIISGNSMNPTLHSENVVLTSNIFFTPEKGDLVIVRDPHGYNIVKRVIALPNETIEIINGTVFLNGDPLEENYVQGKSQDMTKMTVPDGSYFIMGDNRAPGESLDSRSREMGPISRTQILGQAVLSIYPVGFFH